MLVALLLLAAAHPDPSRLQVEASLEGWAKDGKSFKVVKTYSLGEEHYSVTEFNDPSGALVRAFRQKEADAPGPLELAGFREPFGKAAPSAALDAFEASVPLDDDVSMEKPIPSGIEATIKLGRGAVRVHLVQGAVGAHGCPALRLEAALAGSAFVPIFVDPCDTADGTLKDLTNEADASWSPDSHLLAFAWTVTRAPHPPLSELRSRSHVMVMPREKLVTVDLLDCGAGPAMSALRTSLAARFTISHQGKALKARDHSVVYYAPGVQPEAEQIAAMLSANAEVKPLDFASPFAITVAAAK
jgi:hypothetical protein